jgi:CelD/BcsL family acetyltransferase involved in cellulose biosynthesis
LIQFHTHVVSSFAELPASAHALLAAAPTYDLTLPWFEAMARHTLKEDERVEVLWLADASDATALAVLPLVRTDGGAAPIHRRSLRALSNYYCGWFAPVRSPSVDADALATALAQSLVRDIEHWESLDLNPLDPQDPVFPALERGGSAGRCFVQRYFRFGNWYLEVEGRRYADYLRSLPSRQQNTLKRKAKKLDQLGSIRYEILQTTDGLDAVLDAYEDVYAKSWKRVEASPAFVREIAHTFAQRGWLRLGVLWIGARAAATQIWFVYNSTASIFKLAYDPEYVEHSVGSLLTAHLMEHVIDIDRVNVIDYLSGDDAYKRDWMSARRERWGLRMYRLGSVAGFAGAARSVAGTLARRGLSAVRRVGSRDAQ